MAVPIDVDMHMRENRVCVLCVLVSAGNAYKYYIHVPGSPGPLMSTEWIHSEAELASCELYNLHEI